MLWTRRVFAESLKLANWLRKRVLQFLLVRNADIRRSIFEINTLLVVVLSAISKAAVYGGLAAGYGVRRETKAKAMQIIWCAIG